MNAEDTNGNTPLHLAAQGNPTPAVLEVLLKAGAKLNAKSTYDWTPLHSDFFAKNPNPALLEVLLKAGIDVNAKTTDGSTLLHSAAAKTPNPAVLEVLLKAGADPRALDNAGQTPYGVALPANRDILWKAMMDKPLK